ncbi:response regulator transcription factor [Gorillibacterium sp. sgz5001074]|uniref:response regulator transcription factor n=1 Tax=Gorillibacterium sp. sgz5001074 TaxID=3446695 RepID=UPI003F66F522
MKLLIVDDERKVRRAVRLLMDWEAFGFHSIREASNGDEAIELIRSDKPNLVITDMMMPMKDGIGLMTWIADHHPGIRVIVISGYSNMQLVRETMKYGGIDYILKPIVASQMEDTIRRAVKSIQGDRAMELEANQRNLKLSTFNSIYRTNLLSSILDSQPTPALVREIKQEFGLSEPETACRLILLDTGTFNETIRIKYAANPDLLPFTVMNICAEVLPDGQGYVFQSVQEPSSIYIIVFRDSDSAEEAMLRSVREGMELVLGASCLIAVSHRGPFPSGIHLLKSQVKNLLRERNLLSPSPAWIRADDPLEDMAGGAGHRPLYFFAFEAGMRAAVDSENEGQIRQVFHQWVEHLHASGYLSYRMLEDWILEFKLLLKRWLLEKYMEIPDSILVMRMSLPHHSNGDFALTEWSEQLAHDLIRIIRSAKQMNMEHRGVAHQIAAYLQNNCEENISLQVISAKFFLSKGYISRLFKLEYGETIPDYLTRMRMEKAKVMLHNPDLRISEIAQRVGFEDEKYFYKVFKKHVGLSPNQFRQHKMSMGMS